MKRFLISIVVGITCMAMGATMLFFEIKDFKTVNACDVFDSQKITTETFTLKNNETFQLILNQVYVDYEIVYDETMKDKVKVEISDYIGYRLDKNTMKINWNDVNHNDHYLPDEDNGFKWIDKIMDGLKEHTFYYCNNYTPAIRITSARANKGRINIVENN